MTPASPAPPPAAPPAECPIEFVFPDGRYPCRLPRGHSGAHDYTDAPAPWPDEAPAAPPAGGPQEAATPPQALAAELDAMVAEQRAAAEKYRLDSPDRDWAVAEAGGIAYAARQVRERLAPAWDALAAGRDRWGDALHRIALGQVPDGTPAAQLAYDALDGATPGPDTLAALAAENERLRALAAEILGEITGHCDDPNCPGRRLLVSEGDVAGWRQRAGLEARDGA